MVSQAHDHISRSDLVAAVRELDRARAANDALWIQHAEGPPRRRARTTRVAQRARPWEERRVSRRHEARQCTWCSKPNRAEPALLVHRRSGRQEQLSVCPSCLGEDSTLWLQFREPDHREAA